MTDVGRKLPLSPTFLPIATKFQLRDTCPSLMSPSDGDYAPKCRFPIRRNSMPEVARVAMIASPAIDFDRIESTGP